MSFLKISDPVKRDLIVKEYLELKKNIRDNLRSERTGEQQLQTDISKFYRPITETQKATTREIMEGLTPIKEGIENLPQALRKEELSGFGEIAKEYLDRPDSDETFGIRRKKGEFYIGDKLAIIVDNDLVVGRDEYEGTPGLWELIVSKEPKNFTEEDYENYANLMVKTAALHRGNDPENKYQKSSSGYKWRNILRDIWYKERDRKEREKYLKKLYKGKGVVVIPGDPNALLERLDLLLASQKAGHTGVRNELVSICDELKRQGVLDTRSYKKLNSIIKK